MGYQVIGYAASAETTPGQEDKKNTFRDFDFALKTRKKVVALGFRVFATAEEAADWAHNARK
jgi:hypothetical protein